MSVHSDSCGQAEPGLSLLLLGPALHLESAQDGSKAASLRPVCPRALPPAPLYNALYVLPAGTNPQEEFSHLTTEERSSCGGRPPTGAVEGEWGIGSPLLWASAPSTNQAVGVSTLSQEGKGDHGPAPLSCNCSPIHVHPHL